MVKKDAEILIKITKHILKLPDSTGGDVTIETTFHHKLLEFGEDAKGQLCVWVGEDHGGLPGKQKFRLDRTGDIINYSRTEVHFWGTAICKNGDEWHLSYYKSDAEVEHEKYHEEAAARKIEAIMEMVGRGAVIVAENFHSDDCEHSEGKPPAVKGKVIKGQFNTPPRGC